MSEQTGNNEAIERDEAFERFEAGNKHLKDNCLDEAMEEFRAAVKANEDFAEAYNNLGLTMFYKSSFDEAIEEFKNAIKIDPEFPMAHANLGLAFLNKDMVDEAIKELTKAVSLDNELPEAYYNLGLAYAKKGVLPDAIAAYEGFLKHASEHFRNYVEGVEKIVAQLKIKIAGNS
jgi:tetratricopeptide (TPR) repeat protein